MKTNFFDRNLTGTKEFATIEENKSRQGGYVITLMHGSEETREDALLLQHVRQVVNLFIVMNSKLDLVPYVKGNKVLIDMNEKDQELSDLLKAVAIGAMASKTLQ